MRLSVFVGAYKARIIRQYIGVCMVQKMKRQFLSLSQKIWLKTKQKSDTQHTSAFVYVANTCETFSTLFIVDVYISQIPSDEMVFFLSGSHS